MVINIIITIAVLVQIATTYVGNGMMGILWKNQGQKYSFTTIYLLPTPLPSLNSIYIIHKHSHSRINKENNPEEVWGKPRKNVSDHRGTQGQGWVLPRR